eukprot:5017446-Prymnesium_polylepis.1
MAARRRRQDRDQQAPDVLPRVALQVGRRRGRVGRGHPAVQPRTRRPLHARHHGGPRAETASLAVRVLAFLAPGRVLRREVVALGECAVAAALWPHAGAWTVPYSAVPS